MFSKRLVLTALLLTLVFVLVLSACAKPAPAPTPTPSPAPAPTPTPAPKPPTPLELVIEGAKKEGTISFYTMSSYNPEFNKRLAGEISKTFGVDLDIKFGQETSMPKDLAAAIMEQKAGATPTYDFMVMSGSQTVAGMEAGVFERVDWKPLITKDTNPETLFEDPALRGAIVINTSHFGLMYSPEEVSAAEVPKTLDGMADPKWKGKMGIHYYTSSWGRWAFYLGKEKGIEILLPKLKAIVNNGAVIKGVPELFNSYLLGETPIIFTSSTILQGAWDKGVRAEWSHLDVADVVDFSALVRTGAPHPNAAKLVAVYFASPEGARFLAEVARVGTRLYPGNYENDLSQQAQKLGIPVYRTTTFPGFVKFSTTEEFGQWKKEIRVTLQGG